MSQLQKMRAGETYSMFDSELDQLRQKAERLLFLFNHEPERDKRRGYLEELGIRIHPSAHIQQPFTTCYGCHISLGAESFINWDAVILDHGGVTIGDQVFIGPKVQIYTVNHALDASARVAGEERASPVVIGDRVWVGGGVIILPGVTIGDEAVIAAGAVVTRDVAPGDRVGGNPARSLVRE